MSDVADSVTRISSFLTIAESDKWTSTENEICNQILNLSKDTTLCDW
jgi:hypothetical protein